jgi:hypothetical protein
MSGAAAVSLEGGVQEIDLREKNGKLRVSRSCVCYLEERRLYHRKDGEIVRLRDDVLAAARYGMMMRRFFKPLDECDSWQTGVGWPSGGGGGSRGGGSRNGQIANGTDFDVWTGR